jgi:hypothetical protein
MRAIFMSIVTKLVSSLVGSRPYRLCKSAGLTIEESDGDSAVVSFEGDRITPRRLMYVGDINPDLILFNATVRGTIPADRLPAHFLLDLLGRRKWAGTWTARTTGGEVRLTFQYHALSKGVDADMCMVICRTMIREVGEIENQMAAQGLLS